MTRCDGAAAETNGALYRLDTAEPPLRPTVMPAPANPKVPGCDCTSASEPTVSSSMNNVTSPSGVWLFSTVPVRA